MIGAIIAVGASVAVALYVVASAYRCERADRAFRRRYDLAIAQTPPPLPGGDMSDALLGEAAFAAWEREHGEYTGVGPVRW